MAYRADDKHCGSTIRGSDFVYDETCQPCSEDGLNNEAEEYCADCGEFLCIRCAVHHKEFSSLSESSHLKEKHKIRIKRNVHGRDPCTITCPNDNDKRLRYHCTDHSIIGCSFCVLRYHNKCEGLRYIQHVSKYLRSSIEYEQFHITLDNLILKLKQVHNDLDLRRLMLTESLSNAVAAIQCAKDSTYLKEELISQVECQEKIGRQALENLKSELISVNAELDTLSKETMHLDNSHLLSNLYVRIAYAKYKCRNLDNKLKILSENISDVKMVYFDSNMTDGFATKHKSSGFTSNPFDAQFPRIAEISSASVNDEHVSTRYEHFSEQHLDWSVLY